MEEAANIAAEFIASLDNLPNEVAFLLSEIRYKDTRCQELMDSINKDSGKYIRHSLRSTNSNASTPTPNGNGSSLGAFTAKDEQTPDKVKHDYAEIDRLTVDKVRLCEKLNALIARVRVRLDHDLKKVLILQGDLDPSKSTPALTATPSFSTNMTNAGHLANTSGLVAAIGTGVGGAATNTGNAIAMSGAGMPSGLGPSGYSGTVHGVARNPVQMMNESLRNAMAGVEPLIAQQQQQQQPGIVSTPTATANNKRIRKAASAVAIPSIKLPSPAPQTIHVPQRHAPPAPSATTHRPSPGRPPRQQHQQKVPTPVPPPTDGGDEDAEGEEDMEGLDEADVDDDTIYCTCRRTSFGEMVACDNPNCPYEWFHLPCVNLKPPLPESWYCAECVSKGFAPPGFSPVGSGAGMDPPSLAGGGSRKRKR